MKKLVLFAVFAAFAKLVAAQTITANGAPFNAGDPMVFDFTGAPANATDWIGIYSPGEVPDGDPPSFIWNYTAGTAAGTVTLDGILPAGDYVAHLFCCDGYDILASVNFSVVGDAPAAIFINNYPFVGGTVSFGYTGGPGNDTDWIGIYADGTTPGVEPSVMFQYVTGQEGELTFDLATGDISAGNYQAHLFCCDLYTILATVSFSIFETTAPAINPLGTLSQTGNNTFEYSGGTGSLYDWVGIYPAGEVPDGDPTSISYLYVNGPNGTVTFDPIPELIPGNFYDAHLFCCDAYDIIASYTNWTVALTNAGEVVLQQALFAASSPSHETARLTFSEPMQGQVNVFSVTGQNVRSLRINGETAVDVEGLHVGTYAVQFIGEKGVQTVKLVVN